MYLLKKPFAVLKAIISGEMDDYPENAFFNVGTIDDVKRAAEKNAGFCQNRKAGVSNE